MIIETIDKQTEYTYNILKAKEKFLEEGDTPKGLEAEKKRTKIFVDSFNKESRRQGSSWYAETEECIRPKGNFILTHLKKKIDSGWWIFKVAETISLHICVYENHTSFVNNDYSFSEYGDEKNKAIYKYLPELRPILQKMPEVFFIMPLSEIHNFHKRILEIRKDMKEIEEKIYE